MSTTYREVKLNKNQHQQYKTVKEFKPEWNDEEIINFCQQRDWEKNIIQDDLQKAFEFDHSSLEQWHTVGTTKKEEKTQTSTSTRGRASERGGRGRGRARSAAAGSFRGGRGGRGGSVAASTDRSNGSTETNTDSANDSQDESKASLSSPTEEKQPLASTENRIHRAVDIREKTGKRAKREKESNKASVSGVQLPTPGKSYAMAVKPLPPPPVVAPVQPSHSTSTSSASHSHPHTHTKKIEEQNTETVTAPSTTEVPKLEEKEEKKVPAVPVQTVPSFASVAKGAWRKKDVVSVTAGAVVSQAPVSVPEIVQPKEEVSKKEFDEEKTETKAEVSPSVVESTPLEEESKPQQSQHAEVVDQLPSSPTEAAITNTIITPQPESSHQLLHSAPKSPAVPKSVPRSPAKSPLKLHESPVSLLHPETHQLPPSVLSVSAALPLPLPAVVSPVAPVSVSAVPVPVSELLTATETVILPQHIIAAVQAPAVQIQFGSAKSGGPRAPQPQQTQTQANIVNTPQTSAPQAAPVQATAPQSYAAASLGSQRTVPISSILGTVNAVQAEAKFTSQPAAETATVAVAVAAAPEQTFEQHHPAHAAITHPTEEQTLLQQQQQQQQTQVVAAAPQTYADAHAQPVAAAHAGGEHQHNIYGANFPTLAQASTAAAVGGPVSGADNYGGQAAYVSGDQQGDMYSMYGADQQSYQSMYGDQFYGQQMRRGGPQDVKGKPKFNAIGPNQQTRGPQQHNKPHQQQQQQRQAAPQQQPFTNQQAQAQRITPGGYQAANQYNNQVQYKQPNVPASPQHNLPQYQQQQQQQQPGKGAVGQYKPNQYNQAKNVPMNQPINQTPGMVSNQFGYGMHAGAYGTSAAPYLSYPQQYYGGYYGMQQQQPFYRQPQYPFYPSTYSSYPAPMTGGFDQTAYDANGQPDFSKHYAQQPANAQAAQPTDIQTTNVSAQSAAVDNTNPPAAQYADASWQQMKTNPAKPADSQFQTNYAAMQNVSAIHQQQQTHIPQQPHAMVHQPIQPHMQAQQNTYGAPFQPHMPVHPADAQRAAFPNWGQPNTM